MNQEEIQESRLRLQQELDARKLKIAKGILPPTRSLEELRSERNAMENVLSIGDVMKEVLPKLLSMEAKLKAHSDNIREKIAGLEPEFCIEHPEQLLEVDEDLTIGKSWKNNAFTVFLKPCPTCKAITQEISAQSRWLDLGIPHKVLKATFDNFDTEVDSAKQKVLKKFQGQVKRGNGFILAVGLWGTGKSHLAAATIKAIGHGIFITEHDLIGELRQTYAENSGQDTLVEKYRSAKVLVLDELTKDVKGVDIAPLLYRVLGYRHDNDLLTVLTSNETIEECMAILGPKLRDRMRENYVIANFTWKSHRQPMEL